MRKETHFLQANEAIYNIKNPKSIICDAGKIIFYAKKKIPLLGCEGDEDGWQGQPASVLPAALGLI